MRQIELKKSKIDQEFDLSSNEELVLQLSCEQTFSIEDATVSIKVTFEMTTSDKKQLVYIVVNNDFGMATIAKYLEDGKVVLPKQYGFKLNDLASANTRGIIYMLFKDTNYKKLVIPLIDFSKQTVAPAEEKKSLK